MSLISFIYYLQIKLLIIDSVSFVFRYDFTDLAYRSRILNTVSRTLSIIAAQHIAVLTSTQATLRGEREKHVPTLGMNEN